MTLATTRTLDHYIDGRLVRDPSRAGGRTAPICDPATGALTAEVRLATVADVGDAVASAARAAATWKHTSLAHRTAIMFRFRELVAARRDDLAAVITSQHGKTLDDARGEVARGCEVVEFACGIANLLKGELSEEVTTGIDVSTVRRPLGVVAGITPFNFPAMVPMWMFPIAIACGNTFVLKPSERDPSASLLLAQWFSEAGLPPGVLNVVNGDRVAVDRLLEHPTVRAISFVGSTPVARHVYEAGTAAGKRVQALGGAKNHMVVLEDADLAVSADAAISAGFGAAGERCMAISVVVAVGDAGDALVNEIRRRIPEIRIGAGDEAGVDMGPLITREHRDRVAAHIDVARDEGATVAVDGRVCAVPPGGFFLGPSLLDHVTPEMTAYREEIFGPVLSVVRVATLGDALELVNGNAFGNGTAIFTRDGHAAHHFASEVEVGMVGVNVPIPVPVASHSFGGWKSSLFGDTHMYGPEGVRFYTRNKVVTSRWPTGAPRAALDLQFPRSS